MRRITRLAVPPTLLPYPTLRVGAVIAFGSVVVAEEVLVGEEGVGEDSLAGDYELSCPGDLYSGFVSANLVAFLMVEHHTHGEASRRTQIVVKRRIYLRNPRKRHPMTILLAPIRCTRRIQVRTEGDEPGVAVDLVEAGTGDPVPGEVGLEEDGFVSEGGGEGVVVAGDVLLPRNPVRSAQLPFLSLTEDKRTKYVSPSLPTFLNKTASSAPTSLPNSLNASTLPCFSLLQ